MRNFIFYFILFLLCAPHANAQFGSVDIDPRIYKSKNGKYELFINPSNRQGAGSAEYKLSSDGKELWKKEFPFTLVNTVVSNDGISAGYGLTKGTGSFANGEFIVATVSHDGNVLAEDRTKQAGSHFMHTSPDPKASKIILDENNDRFIVDMMDPNVNRRINALWIYQLSTGKKTGTFEPKTFMENAKPLYYDIAIKPIEATPLVLIQWWSFENSRERKSWKYGTRFTLVDLQCKPVWTLDWPTDYTIPNDEKAQDALNFGEIRETGTVVKASEPRKFTLRQVATSKAITFEVTKDEKAATGWSVREVSREDYAPNLTKTPATKEQAAENPALQPKYLGIIQLGVTAAALPPVLNNIIGFRFNAQGKILLLTSNRSGERMLLLVETNGKILNSFSEPRVFNNDVPLSTIAPATGDTWILAGSGLGENRGAIGGFLNVTNGEFTALPKVNVVGIKNLEYTKDGEFIISSGKHEEYFLFETLFRSDRNGNIKWTLGNKSGTPESQIVNPEDIAVTSDGDVTVVETNANVVRIYDSKGNHKNTISLDAAWERQANYPSDITADRRGGFIIHDFGADPEFVHMDRTGKVIREFTPAFPDGRKIRISGTVEVDIDDHYWVTDRTSLYQLDENGNVNKTIGDDSLASRPELIHTLEVDRNDRIYAVDRRIGYIHIFEPDGRAKNICRLDPREFKESRGQQSLMIADSGDVFIQSSASTFKQFDRDGRSAGDKGLQLDPINQQCFSKPHHEGLWVVGYEQIFLLDNNWKVIDKIDRNRDGGWLQPIRSARCARDGTLAIYDETPKTKDRKMHIYESDGRARTSFALPPFDTFCKFAFDGSRFVVIKGTKALGYDSSGNCLFEFDPSEMERVVGAYFAKDGRELLLFDGQFTLYRYEMPAK